MPARAPAHLIDAALALNQAGGGRLDERSPRLFNGVLAGEQVPRDVRLAITDPGARSSRPAENTRRWRIDAASPI